MKTCNILKALSLTIILVGLTASTSMALSTQEKQIMDNAMTKAVANLNVDISNLSQEEMVKYHNDLHAEYSRIMKEEQAKLEAEKAKAAEAKAEAVKAKAVFKATQGTLEHRKEVLRFQASKNITADGSIGPQTKEIIETGKTISDKIENPPSKGKWLAIDLTLRNITLYEGQTVIKKYPITVGKNGSKTPEGKTKVVEKIKNRRWNGAGQYKPIAGGDPKNPLGPRWLGFSSNIGTGYGAHGTNDEWSIGKNASMGCIRLLNDDIKELYEMVPTGIPVWIGHTETLEKWGLYKVAK